MICFYPVIKILALSDYDFLKRSFVVGSDGFFVSSTLIKVDHLGTAIIINCFNQELMRCLLVPSFGEQEIYGISFLVHSPVQIHPFTLYFDIRFVHSPTITCWLLSFAESGFN